VNKIQLILVVIILTLAGCSTERNTLVTRTYHSVTAKYNIFFNGNESFKNGIKKQQSQFPFNYAKILPIFLDSNADIANTISSDMETAIRKSIKLISLHSIKSKPKLKGKMSEKKKKFFEKNEYNRWVDDGYMLIGRAQFYKMDYIQAEQTFLFIIDEFKNEPVKLLAQLWLIRVYIATKEFSKAKSLIDEFSSNKKNIKKHAEFFYSIYADYYLQQDDYKRCIEKLTFALKKIHDKKTKTRYFFILAQLNEKIGNYYQATELYNKVIKRNPPYEMAFNAMIKAATLADMYKGSNKEVKKQLNRMLKDTKNKEYLDQIYYALAKIAMREKNISQTIDYLKLSSASSLNNKTQKVMSCLSIADIYYNEPNYSEAKKYYDTALNFIDIDYPDYNKILQNVTVLRDLVTNLNIIQYEDSLQNIAKMDEASRNKLIDKLVEKAVEEEKKQQELMQSQTGKAFYNQYETNNFRENLNETGKWYFYNTSAMSFGQSEFVKKWGKRKLEDNWRRSNKQTVQIAEEKEPVKSHSTSDSAKTSSEEPKNKYNKTNRNYYLADLPLTPEKIQKSNERIAEALFNAAKIYKEKLNDYQKAVSTYEILINRFPEHENIIIAYYDLYLIFSSLQNIEKANIYKNLIMVKFPSSNYVKILSNPNYFEDLEKERLKIEEFYTQTYDLFSAGQYQQVLQNCEIALNTYKDSYLLPNFAFLKAVASGKLSNQIALKSYLSDFINNYPDAEITSTAKDIISRIEEQELAYLKTGENIKENINDKTVDEITNLYSLDTGSAHYFIALVKKTIDINLFKFKITNFVVDNFNFDDYSINDEVLNSTYHIIVVKGFTNATDAMNFLTKLQSDTLLLKDFSSDAFQLLIISANNYNVLLNDKSVAKYYEFYKLNYNQ
jgi:tetratricopeptide (TPR) repeat protein